MVYLFASPYVQSDVEPADFIKIILIHRDGAADKNGTGVRVGIRGQPRVVVRWSLLPRISMKINSETQKYYSVTRDK